MLEGADADMGPRDAGEDAAGNDSIADDGFATGDGGEGAGGGHTEGGHGFGANVFAKDGAEGGATVAAARVGSLAGAFELDVAAESVFVDDLAEKNGSAIAELGIEVAELMP